MSKEKIDNYKLYFVLGYYLQMYVNENKSKFANVYTHQIYEHIMLNLSIANDFNYFIAKKMSILTYNDLEKCIVKESFLAELN